MVRIIINGKKSADESVRAAIMKLRDEGFSIEVRVTYEYGDVHRLVAEAIADNVERLIVGGGDGSVNEVVDALAAFPKALRPEVAILPLGTANDFASACQIPLDSLQALRFAVSGKSIEIDIVKVNERHFVNMATVGFGAQVTAETPVELKNLLGKDAYILTGIVRALNFVAYAGKVKTPHNKYALKGIVGAICNGKQAGGGQVLAPAAKINDGLLDVVMVLEFPLSDVGIVIGELQSLDKDGQYVKYFQTTWLEGEAEEPVPINLDGEPYSCKKIRYEVLANAIKLVIPASSPCLI